MRLDVITKFSLTYLRTIFSLRNSHINSNEFLVKSGLRTNVVFKTVSTSESRLGGGKRHTLMTELVRNARD